jgi:hypothetical protein
MLNTEVSNVVKLGLERALEAIRGLESGSPVAHELTSQYLLGAYTASIQEPDLATAMVLILEKFERLQPPYDRTSKDFTEFRTAVFRVFDQLTFTRL